MMERWKSFIDSIDTPGGHIVVAIFLGLLGVGVTMIAEFYKFSDAAKAAQEMTQFLAVAGYAMRGSQKANGKNDPPKPPQTNG